MSQPNERAPLTIQRSIGKAPGTLIFHFNGSLTARDMFKAQIPQDFRGILDPVPGSPAVPVTRSIFVLSDVPYMDSSGLGAIARHFADCRGQGVKFVIAAAHPRILELFKMTKMDTVITLVPTLEEAETI